MLRKITETLEQNDDMNKIIAKIYESDIIIMASPSYWGDVTGQMKVFIDRCMPYCNVNPNRLPIPIEKTGIVVAVRAGQNKKENKNLITTIEHFLGYLDIPLKYQFTIEGMSTEQDLKNNPSVLEKATDFGKEIVLRKGISRNRRSRLPVQRSKRALHTRCR
ncbi:MAG: NAD(P)H-dependent oxidoreductase [Fibromonadaceae bacterium]|nr:NAD(P)H-dependent oxidoreductase [Fibromonadaceae bacterium]